jgi:transposase
LGQYLRGYIPLAVATPEVRRSFSAADKKRIVGEAEMPGASLSAVARRHGIGTRLLFRWKKDLALPEPPVFLPVSVDDAGAPTHDSMASPRAPVAAPIIVERQAHGIEVELVGGRRVRFDRDADPETVRAMIAVLEGVAP